MTLSNMAAPRNAPHSSHSKPKREFRVFWRVAAPLISAAILLTIWQILSETGAISSQILPAPTRIINAAISEHQALLHHAVPTLVATIAGFLLSVCCSFIIASLLDLSFVLKLATLPLLIVSQTLPIIALAPLIVVWFGFGLWPKVLLVAFVTFFPMVVSLLQGFASAEPDTQSLLRSMGATKWQIFKVVRLPASMPYFFSGLRISITYAVIAAIFAEYAGAVSGLGVYMQTVKNVFRTDLMLAAVLVTSILTLLLYGLVLLLEYVLLPWLRIEHGNKSGQVAR